MTAQELESKVWEKAVEFGILTQAMKEKEGRRGSPNAMKRSNVSDLSFADAKAYFGYVRPEENPSGAYYDLSFVVFPQKDGGKCIVAIVVGSAGYQRDYELASTPGARRLFTKLTNNDGCSFIKNDFTDIDSPARELLEKVAEEEDLNPLQSVTDTYSKLLLAARIVDPDTEFDIIAAWLAQYAKLRNWGTKGQIRKQETAIRPYLNTPKADIQKDILKLLESRRFVVLQGAPGTGKTYNALEISRKYAQTIFTQFHAETNYSDFVEGISPKLNDDSLKYISTKGKLIEAIEAADKWKGKRVLLIIDEINRANLANVLGPVFYLFENQTGAREVNLRIGEKEISRLPDNLDVIATMNTADRSLAVVDFALRRRFAWYTIRPQEIIPSENQVFHKELFGKFCDIFDRYASDDELNLQPGPSYFLTSKEDADAIMKDRIVYELMPLVKEYLAEGLMRKAGDSFAQLFYEETGKYLYE